MSEYEVPEKNGWIAVSVEFAYEHPEYDYHRFNAELDECGLDPWRYIDCDLDKPTDCTGYLLFGKKVQRGHIVYMQPPQQNSEDRRLLDEYRAAFLNGEIPPEMHDRVKNIGGEAQRVEAMIKPDEA